MNDASSYWFPLCELVSQFRWWVRLAWKEGSSRTVTPWGQLLTIPTHGYLEGPGDRFHFDLWNGSRYRLAAFTAALPDGRGEWWASRRRYLRLCEKQKSFGS